MIRKKFGMISLGCDKNRVDGERILAEIRAHGCEITDDIDEAEILVVNTCAFLNAARQEAVETVIGERAHGRKLEKIVVTGCLPQKYAAELFPALTEGDVFLGTNDCSALFPALERAYAGERVNAVGQGGISALRGRVVTTPEHFKYLKISEGCSGHCTYCLIPKIRGKYRSYPLNELIAEAKSLGETEELVLVAQDITRYGEDLGENIFVKLLKKISELDNICHIRLLYCYPDRLTDELIAEIRDNAKIIKYLDIPLQHSEDRVLKLMGRKGTREEYSALLKKLRREIPGIAVRTTFITGFPTETEEEHGALISFLREERFTNCGIFAYSREPETPAYRMKGQIPAREKKRRQKELYAAQAEVSRAFLQEFAGKTVEVVCDGIDYEKSCFVGRAYFQAPEIDGAVYFRAAHATQGKRYTVRVERADTYDLYGYAEEEL